MCSIPSPNGIAVCTNGTILVSSFDNTIYKVTQRGILLCCFPCVCRATPSSPPFLLSFFPLFLECFRKSTSCLHLGKDFEPTVLAGSGRTGTVDGKPQECSFNRACGLAVHEASHSCFVVDRGSHTIRKISFVNS